MRLARSRAQVVLTSGNHDSAQRLGFSSRLIDAAGVFIRSDAATVGTPVTLADPHGPVAVYGLPYLDPLALADPGSCARARTRPRWSAAMQRVRRDLAARSPGTRSVVLAHAFVAGGEPSESERDISVGGVSRVPVGVFDGVDYVALGHLHGAQVLSERVRYSGSPLLTRSRSTPGPRGRGSSISVPRGRCTRRSWRRPCRGGSRGCAAGSTTCLPTPTWWPTSSAGCRPP